MADSQWSDERRPLALIGLAMTAVLLLRVRLPLMALLPLVALFQVETAVIPDGSDDPMSFVLLMLVGLYSAGAHARGRSFAAAAFVVVATTFVSMYQDGNSTNIGGFLFFAFFIGGPFVAGWVIRIRREREHSLVAEREERARAAVAEERTRIARELHDVVAHAVSVIVLQARGARHALDNEPRDAREAVDAIESTAAGALAEMRRLLGMLRADDETLALAPQPSLAGLEALAEQVREAGLPIELRIEGEARELPPGVDLSAYRIVQEGLTNVLKHAGPRACARVLVRYGDEQVEIEVADDGAGGTNGDAAGHRLLGMREHVTVFGGVFESGPRPDGGFTVRAHLPL
ncbi:MAG TPA: histidine kinase [Gaiellaceae bacterium]|nr:histidine kinase [Gaiellaceae bacterium]